MVEYGIIKFLIKNIMLAIILVLVFLIIYLQSEKPEHKIIQVPYQNKYRHRYYDMSYRPHHFVTTGYLANYKYAGN